MTDGFQKKAKGRRFGYTVAALLLVFALVYAGAGGPAGLLEFAGRWLVVETPLEKSDLIYVYAGGVPERPFHAAELYREKYAPKTAVGGVLVDSTLLALDKWYNEGTVNRRLLVRYGVAENDIFQIWDGTSTMEETIALRRLAEAQGLRSVILVSSPFHMRRVRFCAQRAFKGSGITLRYAPVKDSLIRPDSWWMHENGLISVTVEYIKLAYYHLKY